MNKIGLNKTLSTAQAVSTNGIQKCRPTLIALFRITRFATREKITKSVAESAELLVSHSRLHVVPSFRSRSTISTIQILVRILTECSNGVTYCRIVIGIMRGYRRGKC